MHFNHPFDDTFRREVELMTQDSTLSDNALHTDAERYLQVLAHPSFGEINQPAWVRRIQRFWGIWITYTSSKLFDALYQTADELGVIAGKRYVSAAVCVCVSRTGTESVAASLDDRPRRIAEALSQLASAWIAFMLWPFFVDGVKAGQELLARPSRRSLRQSLEPPSSQNHDGRRLDDEERLLRRSGYTCFMSGCVHFYAPRELFRGPLPVTVTDLRATHIFRPPRAMRERGMRDDDEVVTSDILKQYCYPISLADGIDVQAEGITEARNSLVIGANSCQTFNSFRWCLRPSPGPNQYHIEVYQRNHAGAQYIASPVTFEDHSHKFSSSESSQQHPAAPLSSNCGDSPPPRAHGSQGDIDLPSADLLRVHAALAGVLQLSGAITAFDAIFYSCQLMDASRIPGASGSTFLKSVVAYEGQQVCSDAEVEETAEDDSD